MPLTHAMNRDLAAMSQSVSSQSRSTLQAEPSDAMLPKLASADLRFDLNQPITADKMAQNATDLMNLLFAEVDQTLEGEDVGSIEPSAEATESLGADEISGLEATMAALLSSQLVSFAPKVSPRDLMPTFEPEAEESEPSLEVALEPPTTPQTASRSNGGSLWFVTLCGSLLLSLGILSFLYRAQVSGLWLTLLETYRPAPATVANSAAKGDSSATTANTTANQPPEQADFLVYLKRSLERLSRHAELPPSPVASPSVIVSPATSPGERVYVPIYPTVISPAPAPAQGSTAQPAQRSAPGSSQTRSQTTSPGSQSAKPLPSVSPANPLPSVAAVPNIETATNHTLIGVLELGERSAALFDVNGTPKRIEVGDQIGSSGWTLVSISNQEAIVRRNGEVRSIYVGQKF